MYQDSKPVEEALANMLQAMAIARVGLKEEESDTHYEFIFHMTGMLASFSATILGAVPVGVELIETEPEYSSDWTVQWQGLYEPAEDYLRTIFEREDDAVSLNFINSFDLALRAFLELFPLREES